MIKLYSLFTFISIFQSLVHGHRSLPSGVTCGNQFATPEDALLIPDTKISWASYRILSCDAPVMWLRGRFQAGQTAEFTVGAPELERFSETRGTVVFIGSGLPALKNSEKAMLPESIVSNIGEGEGAVIFESPEDQSTCDHLQSEEMQKTSDVINNRCNFYEEFGGSSNWVTLDQKLTVPEAGEYRIALFNAAQTTTKIWIACCDWPEDFRTPHDIPVAECPYCGTQVGMNTAWASLYYEHKSMTEFGGFPALQSCVNDNSKPAEPEKCPADQSGDDTDDKPQDESCILGCSKGECHSHNIFGECSYAVKWAGDKAMLGMADVHQLILFKGDTVVIKTPADDAMVYNMFRLPSEEAFEKCDFSGAIEVASTEEIEIGKSVTFANEGMHYFAAGIGCNGGPMRDDCQCAKGLKLAVEVKDASEGRRCHKHTKNSMVTEKEDNKPTEERKCGDNMVMVHSVGDKQFGATEFECSQFCYPQFLVRLTPGIKEGGCQNEGFFIPLKEINLPCGQNYNCDISLFKKPGQRRRLQNKMECANGDINAFIVGNAVYGAESEQCSELCTPRYVLQWLEGVEEGACFDNGYTMFVEKKAIRPENSPMEIDVTIMEKPFGCPQNTVLVNLVGNANYGASSSQCSEFCTAPISIQFINAKEGGCADAGYPEFIEKKNMKPAGSPMAIEIRILAKGEEDETQKAPTGYDECHCHSYEKIACDESGQDLYDEHIEEITTHCQGVVNGEETCPYLCFQPFEVLHLYYLECDTRPEDELYRKISAAHKCHKAATAKNEGVCEDGNKELWFNAFEDFQLYVESLDEAQCGNSFGKWKNGKKKCTAPRNPKKVKCNKVRDNEELCIALECATAVTKKGKKRCKGVHKFRN